MARKPLVDGRPDQVLGILRMEQVRMAEVERGLLGWIEANDEARHILAAEKGQRVEAIAAETTAGTHVQHGHRDIAKVVVKRSRNLAARDRVRVVLRAHSLERGRRNQKVVPFGNGRVNQPIGDPPDVSTGERPADEVIKFRRRSELIGCGAHSQRRAEVGVRWPEDWRYAIWVGYGELANLRNRIRAVCIDSCSQVGAGAVCKVAYSRFEGRVLDLKGVLYRNIGSHIALFHSHLGFLIEQGEADPPAVAPAQKDQPIVGASCLSSHRAGK